MATQTTKIIFYKTRSIAGRFAAAFDFIENNFKIIVKYGSLILMLTAVLNALLLAISGNSVLKYFQFGFSTQGSIRLLLIIAGITFIYLAGNILFNGIIYTLVKEYPQRDSLERIQFKEIKNKIILNSKRFLMINVVFILFGILFSILLIGMFMLSVWTLLLFIPLIIFIFIPFAYTQQIFMFEEIKVMKALKKGLRMGWYNWSGTFFLLLLACIFTQIISMVVFTPWQVGMYVQSLSFISVLDGNAPNLPSYFGILMFVFFVVGFFIASLAQLIPSVSMMFQYFSATQKAIENEAEKAEINQSL